MKALGRRAEVAVGVVTILLVSAALIYATYAQDGLPNTTTVPLTPGSSLLSVPGTPCDGNLNSYVESIEQSSQFAQVSGGECYNYMGSGSVESQGQPLNEYTFQYFDGTVNYPCGTSPAELPESEVQVLVPENATGLAQAMFQLDNDSSPATDYGCPPIIPPLGIVSAHFEGATFPPPPPLNLTLVASDPGKPITGLTAVIESQGGNSTLLFAGVTPNSPLQPGQTVSVLSLLGVGATMMPGVVYSATIQGEYADGSSFNYTVQITPVN